MTISATTTETGEPIAYHFNLHRPVQESQKFSNAGVYYSCMFVNFSNVFFRLTVSLLVQIPLQIYLHFHDHDHDHDHHAIKKPEVLQIKTQPINSIDMNL